MEPTVQSIIDKIIPWIPQVVISLLQGDLRRAPERQPDIPEEEEHLLLLNGAPNVSRVAIDHNIDITVAGPELEQWKFSDAQKEQQIAAALREVENLQKELSTATSQNTELHQRCEILSRDLEAARLFTNTADVFADSEVIQMLQKLNADLQHMSTFMADHLVNVFNLDVGASNPEQRMQPNRLSESIGSTLVKCLQTSDHSEVSMYLQIAFQAYLTCQLHSFVSSWTEDQGSSTVIDDVYQRLREKENQAIAGRWRSLTRVYAMPTCIRDPLSLVAPIISGLSDILLVAGCTAPQSNIRSELSSRFGQNISSAIVLAGRLNRMIAAVISGDFEVLFARPGEVFVEAIMEEDTDGSGDVQETLPGAGSAQTVVCTTHLGLTKQIALGTTGEKEAKMVIKTKVILENFLGNEKSW